MSIAIRHFVSGIRNAPRKDEIKQPQAMHELFWPEIIRIEQAREVSGANTGISIAAGYEAEDRAIRHWTSRKERPDYRGKRDSRSLYRSNDWRGGGNWGRRGTSAQRGGYTAAGNLHWRQIQLWIQIQPELRKMIEPCSECGMRSKKGRFCAGTWPHGSHCHQ